MDDLKTVTGVVFKDQMPVSKRIDPMAIHVRSGDRQALRDLFAKAKMVLTDEAEKQIFERVERDGEAQIAGFTFAD
jgi:hypothetical protein